MRDLLLRPDLRLLTLTGPGGVGKTRLAIQVGSELIESFSSGVVFVPVAALTDPATVMTAIATALDIVAVPGQPLMTPLSEHLAKSQLLLVIDNLEQVIAAGLEIAALLQSCPQVKALVTSRIPLRVHGEQQFPVPPLAVPPDGAAPAVAEIARVGAVELWMHRARAVEPEYQLTAANTGAVAEICRRLDGLPLAIELAAAWSKVLSPDAILDQLTNRLALLTDGPRDQPTRLQTIRAAIAWSVDLLSDDELALFRQLAVFAGGFDLTAARAVAGAKGDRGFVRRLAALVDSSLLRSQPSEANGGAPRFGMLETIREYALELLAESGQVTATRDAHLRYFLAMADADNVNTLDGPVPMDEHAVRVRRLSTEYDNLRAAMAWAIESADAERAQGLTFALGWFWHARGLYREGRQWLTQALALPGETPPLLHARTIGIAAFLAMREFDVPGAIPHVEAYWVLVESRDWPHDISVAGAMKAQLLAAQGAFARAQEIGERALAAGRQVKFLLGTIMALISLGQIALLSQHPERAEPWLREALELCRQSADLTFMPVIVGPLTEVLRARGDLAGMIALQREALAAGMTAVHEGTIASTLRALALLAASSGQPAAAVRIFGAGFALTERHRIDIAAAQQTEESAVLADLQTRLGDAAFTAGLEAGRALATDDAIAEAMSFAMPASPPAIPSDDAPPPDLTPREHEVLRLLSKGWTNRAIAEALFVSVPTVKVHVRSILAKLGLDSRTAAATWAVRHGLVDPPTPEEIAR